MYSVLELRTRQPLTISKMQQKLLAFLKRTKVCLIVSLIILDRNIRLMLQIAFLLHVNLCCEKDFEELPYLVVIKRRYFTDTR